MNDDIKLLFARVHRIELLLSFIAGAQFLSLSTVIVGLMK